MGHGSLAQIQAFKLPGEQRNFRWHLEEIEALGYIVAARNDPAVAMSVLDRVSSTLMRWTEEEELKHPLFLLNNPRRLFIHRFFHGCKMSKSKAVLQAFVKHLSDEELELFYLSGSRKRDQGYFMEAVVRREQEARTVKKEEEKKRKRRKKRKKK